MKTDEMIEALGEIYAPAYGDWELSAGLTLTEPTMPWAQIRCEYRESRAPAFQAFGHTIQEAIDQVVLAAYTTLIERKAKPDTVPWSNPGDAPDDVAKFLAAVDAFKEGRDEESQDDGA